MDAVLLIGWGLSLLQISVLKEVVHDDGGGEAQEMNSLITYTYIYVYNLSERQMKPFEDKYGITGEDEMEDHGRQFEDCGHPDQGDLN